MKKLICILAECGVHLLIVVGIILLCLAAFLLCNPLPSLAVLCYAIAAACLAIGIWFIVSFFYYHLAE